MTATATAPLAEGQRAYRPYGAAEALLYCKDRVVVLDGPAGTGKSLGCLNKLFSLCELCPGIRVLILRQTRESLTETTLQLWEDEVVPTGHPILTGARRNIRQAYHFPNKSEVIVGGLDNPLKIMSGQYDIVYIAEATEVSEDDFADVTTRNRRYHPTISFNQIIMDCNPDGPNHWIKRGWETGRITRLQSVYEDNPKYWDRDAGDWTAVGREYVLGTLEAIPQPMKRQRLRYGIWAGAEGAVYDSFDAARDVVEDFAIPDHWPRYVGLDFGAVNTAALFTAEDPDTDLLYHYREYVHGGRTAGQHAHYIALHEPHEPGESPFRAVVGGAGSEGQWRLEFAKAGLPVREPTIKGVDLGISRVYGQHTRGGIKVFRSLAGYLAQKADYRYEPDTLDSTAKIHNQHAYHLLDCERCIVGYLRPERATASRRGFDSLPVYTTN
jgi:PBSX family phage terminase large subunit